MFIVLFFRTKQVWELGHR